MSVKIYDNYIEGFCIEISIPKNADVEFGANKIVNCETAIELRDPPGFIEVLTLKEIHLLIKFYKF